MEKLVRVDLSRFSPLKRGNIHQGIFWGPSNSHESHVKFKLLDPIMDDFNSTYIHDKWILMNCLVWLAICELHIVITLFNIVTRLGGTRNVTCKVLELYFTYAYK